LHSHTILGFPYQTT